MFSISAMLDNRWFICLLGIATKLSLVNKQYPLPSGVPKKWYEGVIWYKNAWKMDGKVAKYLILFDHLKLKLKLQMKSFYLPQSSPPLRSVLY